MIDFALTKSEVENLTDLVLFPDWVFRRKERVDFMGLSTVRRRMSLDFHVNSQLPRVPLDESKAHIVVPFGFLRKAPGRYSDFDVCDEEGKSIPLTTMRANRVVTACIVESYGERVLGGPVPSAIAKSIAQIAVWDKDFAERDIENGWERFRAASRSSDNEALAGIAKSWMIANELQTTADKSALTEAVISQLVDCFKSLSLDPAFWWLLKTSAKASLLNVLLPSSELDRRIIKVSCDEECVLTSQPRPKHKLGWADYPIDLDTPYTGALTYHCEIHTPADVVISSADSKSEREYIRSHSGHKLHRYVDDATELSGARTTAKIRLLGGGWIGAAFMLSLVATAVYAIVWAWPEAALNAESGNFFAVISTTQGILFAIAWRTVHPLAARLTRWLRHSLLISGLVATLATIRWALVPSLSDAEIPCYAGQLNDCFAGLTIASATVALVLAGSYRRWRDD